MHILRRKKAYVRQVRFRTRRSLGLELLEDRRVFSYTAIAITNPSFESQLIADGAQGPFQGSQLVPITSWGYGLLLNPTSAHFTNGLATDGQNVASGSPYGAFTLSQVLAHTPLANKEYRLQVDVGDRLDRSMGAWRIELRSNSSTLASIDDRFLSIPDGRFTTAELVYTTSDQPPSGPLEITLARSNNIPDGFVSFDNVRLSMRDSLFAIPTANEDFQYYTPLNTNLSVGANNSLLLNDYSYEGIASFASLVDQPTNGTLINFGRDGTFVYRPNLGFVGTDTFTYQLSNGILQSSPTRVQISVGTKLLSKLNRDVNVFNTVPDSFGLGLGYTNVPVSSSMETDGALAKTGGLLLAEDVIPGHSLIYRSDDLVRPIIEIESQFPLGISIPTTISAQLTFNGIATSASVFSTAGFVPGERFRFALQADASALNTGRYSYQVNVSANNPSWTQSFSGSRLIVNRSQSPFGQGWWLGDLHRIHEQTDGLILVRGNGDSYWFPRIGATFGFAEGDTSFTRAIKNLDGSYSLTSKDGFVSTFNSSGLLQSQRDRSGNSTSFAYDDRNGDGLPQELVAVTEPYGRTVTIGYTSGRATSYQHFSGRITSTSYSGVHLVGYTLTDPDGTGPLQSPSISFQYASGRLTGRTNALAETTAFVYGTLHGRFIKSIYANGDQWELQPEETIPLPFGQISNLRKPADVYARVIDGQGNLWQFQTDRFGSITKSITPLLNARIYLRNVHGQVYEAREPDPDKAGPETSSITRFGYNAFSDRTLIIAPDGGTTKIKYTDRFRQPVLVIDPVGRTQRTVYDHAGNAVQSLDGAGNITIRTFNSQGLKTQETSPDPDGTGPDTPQTTLSSYDAFGRLTNVQLADGSMKSFGYSNADELTFATDEHGKLTQWTLDNLGRRISSRNRIDAISQTAFDGLSRPVRKTDPLENSTDFTYDKRGRIATVSYPDPDGVGPLLRPLDVLVYDRNSNLLQQRNPESYFTGEIRYRFDSDDRLTGRSHSEYIFNDASTGEDKSVYETYEYDDAGRLSRVNRVGRERAPSPWMPSEVGQATPRILYIYDAVGRMASKIHVSQTGTVLYQENYGYNQAGELVSSTDGQGNTSLNVYDSRGFKIQESTPDPDGAGPQFPLVKRFTYDALGRLSRIDRGFERITRIEYSNRNLPINITEPDPDSSGPLGSPITQFRYDSRGDQTTIISPLGRVTSFEYDDEQRQTVRVDPDPDGNGPLKRPVTRWSYNSADWLLAVTNPRDAVTSYLYDSLGRPTTVQEPDPDDSGPLDAPITKLYYDAGGLVRIADPLNRTTTYTLDKAGRKKTVTGPSNETTNYTYNFYDQVRTVTTPDPDGTGPQSRSITEYVFDQNGRLFRSIDAMQNTTEILYDSANNIKTITDPTNQTTTFNYDGQNRKIRETKTVIRGASQTPQTVSRSLIYDVAGNMVRSIDRNGRLTQYIYDKLDRTIEEKWVTTSAVTTSVTTLTNGALRNESQLVGWTANAATNLTGTFKLLLNGQATNSIAWNAGVTTIRAALEALTGIGVGNIDVAVTSPSTFSRSISIQFKNARAGQNINQIQIVTQGLIANVGGVTPIQQTAVDGITASERQRLIVSDKPTASTAGSWYLGFGSEISGPLSTSADSAKVRDVLNAFLGIDNVSVTGIFPQFEVIFGGTQATTDVQEIRIDAANLYPSGNFVSRTIASNFNDENELMSVSDPSAIIQFNRDGLGRTTSIQNNLGAYPATNFTFHQTFDVASNRTNLRAVHGTVNDFANTYAYDKLDRLTEVLQTGQASGNSIQPKRVSIAYNAINQRTRLDRFESIGTSQHVATTQFSYDTANRLSRIEHGKEAMIFNAHAYLYDRMSRLSKVTSVDGAIQYTYDRLSQLLSTDDGTSPASPNSLSFAFTYDANGNRNNSGYTAPIDDRILKGSGSDTYGYDLEGNVIAMMPRQLNGYQLQLSWDHRNRLTQVRVNQSTGAPFNTINYEYDAFNRLVKRTETNIPGITYWGYDGGINPLLQYDSSTNQLSHRFLWSDQVDDLFADEQKLSDAVSNTVWALADHQGTIKDIVDYNSASGTSSIVNHRRYDAFGNRKSQSGAVDIVFGYTGKYFDEATGLQNSWNRWYSPSLGRFVSQDPIGFAAGDLNLYRYVANGPTNAADPTGLVLIAIDGTGTKEWLTHEKNPRFLPNGRWLSHVRNFVAEYEQEKIWEYGPSKGMTAKDLPDIEDRIYQQLCDRWRNDASKNGEPIDIIGWSRGAYSAMRLARRLKDEGLPLADGTIKKNIPVRFLGLYDPVDMTMHDSVGYGTENQVSPNVQTAVWAHGVEKSSEYQYWHGGKRDYDSDSPYCYNWPRIEVEFDPATDFVDLPIYGTHGAIGGTPGYSPDVLQNYNFPGDVLLSIKTDRTMREVASSVGVPIKVIADSDYGFPKNQNEMPKVRNWSQWLKSWW